MRIEFTQKFVDEATPLGIRRAHVTAAISGHDQIQVIHDEGLLLHIYAKWIQQARTPFLLLVQCQMHESKIGVLSALKVFTDLREDVQECPPLEVLRDLAERFGDEIRIGERTGKFFLQERIPVKHSDTTRLVEHLGRPDHSMSMSMFVRVDGGQSPIARVALAYCLRTDEYAEWVMRGR